MNRPTNLAACLIALALIAAPSTVAAQLVRHYEILPGGVFTYFPSPEGPGIPGCDPSTFECAFGVAGQFSLEFTDPLDTAKFTNLDLTLIGNEDIQSDPPMFGLVTSDRVETWLADRVFEYVPVGAPINLFWDSHFETLSLTDYLNGTVELSGGYDSTFVDGDGLNFQVSARLIPEPGTMSLMAVGLAASLAVRQRNC